MQIYLYKMVRQFVTFILKTVVCYYWCHTKNLILVTFIYVKASTTNMREKGRSREREREKEGEREI